jgi:hypothetical protein
MVVKIWNICHLLFASNFGVKMKKSGFINCMRMFVTFLNICPLYLVNYEMLEYKSNKMDALIYKFLFTSVMALTLVSYFTASIRSSKYIPKVN